MLDISLTIAYFAVLNILINKRFVLRPTSAREKKVEKLWGWSTISHIGGYVFFSLKCRSSQDHLGVKNAWKSIKY